MNITGMRRAVPQGVIAILVCGSLLLGCPAASADPSPAEQEYLAQLYLLAHPSVTAEWLVELGNLACTVRRAGGTTDIAKETVWLNLNAAGVVSSNADVGTLVHVAVDNLCPEVGYP